MKLYFLRHAIAVQRGTPEYEKDDTQRPLTEIGRKKLKAACYGLEHLDPQWDVIVTSPYLRAKETAEIVAEHFDMLPIVREHEALTPEVSSIQLHKYLKTLIPQRSILFVGHEPAMSRHVSSYIFGKSEGRIEMKKAGMACVEFGDVIELGLGTLSWLMTPGQLQRLGRKKH